MGPMNTKDRNAEERKILGWPTNNKAFTIFWTTHRIMRTSIRPPTSKGQRCYRGELSPMLAS
jgi:hypothetical protein